MSTTVARDYEQVLAHPVSAYEEGLRFLRGVGMANDTLRRLVRDLETHGIDYAVIGAVALNQHGYRRFTEDIDMLLTREGLEQFQKTLIGRGYRPAFPGATKKFRSTAENVPVEIITTGEYPGDGKPKAIQFGDPSESFVVIDGVRTVTLEKLIELKLASGMTGSGRLKDLADIQELIRVCQLPRDFSQKLHEYVQTKFIELWDDVNAATNKSEEGPG